MGKLNKVEEAVYEYMKVQNRPYSAADVFSNLHKAHGKTAVVKAMETLASNEKLTEKVYGKSKIYVISQTEFPDVCDGEIDKLEMDTKALNGKCETAKINLKNAKTELQSYLSTLTTEEAKSEVLKLRAEVKKLRERLENAKRTTQDIGEAERKQISKDHKLFISHWRKRKRMTTDLMGAVLEGYPKSKKVFIEDVGIETDEDFNVKIPVV